MWKIRVNENTCTLPNNRKLRETISNQPKISEDPRGRCRFKNRARAHARSRDPPPRDLRERNRGNSTVTDGNKKKRKARNVVKIRVMRSNYRSRKLKAVSPRLSRCGLLESSRISRDLYRNNRVCKRSCVSLTCIGALVGGSRALSADSQR